METKLRKLMLGMIAYNEGDAKRIQHFIKVHALARLIGEEEQLAPDALYILEAAALTHDIGIKNSEKNTVPAAASSRSWKARRKRKNCCRASALTAALSAASAG